MTALIGPLAGHLFAYEIIVCTAMRPAAASVALLVLAACCWPGAKGQCVATGFVSTDSYNPETAVAEATRKAFANCVNCPCTVQAEAGAQAIAQAVARARADLQLSIEGGRK